MWLLAAIVRTKQFQNTKGPSVGQPVTNVTCRCGHRPKLQACENSRVLPAGIPKMAYAKNDAMHRGTAQPLFSHDECRLVLLAVNVYYVRCRYAKQRNSVLDKPIKRVAVLCILVREGLHNA